MQVGGLGTPKKKRRPPKFPQRFQSINLQSQNFKKMIYIKIVSLSGTEKSSLGDIMERAGGVEHRVKWLPVMLISPMSTTSSPMCSASDPSSCYCT